MRKIRLFVAISELGEGSQIKIMEGDFEYLSKVMRQKVKDQIFVFNGIDGEFIAEISAIEKKSLSLSVIKKITDLQKLPRVTLAFALVKGSRIDYISEKATELGTTRFQPIITKHTIVDKLNSDRFKSHIKEACEQCERNDFPELLEVKKLEKFLTEVDLKEKILILCDESGQGLKASKILSEMQKEDILSSREIVILIGPEGGFSEEEFKLLRSLPNLYSISLGQRILRSDTAIIAALTLVQEFC